MHARQSFHVEDAYPDPDAAFSESNSRCHLRELAHDFDASPGHVRSELQQLSAAGLLTSAKVGRQLQYRADCSHPLFPELQSMVRKSLGMDRIVDSIIGRLGKLEALPT